MNIFQEVVKFINSFQQGETFTTLQFHNHMAKLGYRDSYQPHYRINTYRTYLRSAGFVSNVKRGVWRVNYHIPSWATLSALETARGYKGTQAQRKAMRAKIAEYKQAGAQPAWAFKIGDTIQVGTDETVYTIEQHPTNANDVYVTWVDKDGKQSITYDKSYIQTLLTKKNPHWKLVTLKPVEVPKPTETEKPRLMLCVDMSDSSADYVVGKVYELREEDYEYYYFKQFRGGMFKRRFIELKDEVANSVKVLCINNKGGYEDQLTVGKIYEAQPSTDGPAYWKIPVSDKGTSTAGLKSRFTVLTEETIAQREWKVGDTLLTSFLNDPNIEKEFHGYSENAGWNIYAERVFVRDRTVEVIAEREGKMAARISGTMDIWITLESLELHP